MAILPQDSQPLAGYIRTPAEVRRLWSRQKEVSGEHFDILEIEALGPALVLSTWPHLLEGRLWLHFTDNENALAALVRGGTSVHSADCITAWCASRVAELGVWAWFDRVDTKSNPVDGLSRGNMDGPWKLQQIHFPKSLRDALTEYLDEPAPVTAAAPGGESGRRRK